MEALLNMQSAPVPSTLFKDLESSTNAVVSPAKDFETRVTALINRVNSNSPAAQNPQDGALQHLLTAESLLELVKVTAQLSQLEQVAEKTRGCDAVSADAKKWQELTSVALDWSRKSLSEQQRGCIEKVSEVLKRGPDSGQGSPKTCSPVLVTKVPALPCPQAPPVQENVSVTKKASEEDQLSAAKNTPSGFEQGETLRTHLEALANEDPNRILIVRRINRLGFESPLHLEKHLSEYGTVKRVYVAHSRVKPSPKRPVPRVRPAGLGFVLMETEEDATRIANAGPQMVINNVTIEVKIYQPGSLPGKGLDADEE